MRIYLIFSILILHACNAPENKSSSVKANSLNIDGKAIETCKVYSSDFAMVDADNPGKLIQEFRFNKEGYVKEFIRYNANGDILNSFLVNGKHTPFVQALKPPYTDTSLTTMHVLANGDIKFTELRNYNAEGLLIAVMHYNEHEELKEKNTFEYLENGLIKKDIYWNTSTNSPKKIISYKYSCFE